MRISTTLKLLIALLLIVVVRAGLSDDDRSQHRRYVDDQTIIGKVKSKLVADKTSNLTRVGVKIEQRRGLPRRASSIPSTTGPLPRDLTRSVPRCSAW